MSTHVDSERHARLQAAMRTAGHAAVLAWRAEEMVLTTGNLPHWGLSLCLYPQSGEPVCYPFVLEPQATIPDELMQRRYNLLPANGFNAWDELKGLLMDDARRLGCANGPIAFARHVARTAPFGNSAEAPPITVSVIEYLLSDANPTDDSSFFVNQQIYKTAREIEKIRRANDIAAVGLRVFYESLREGYTEVQVASAIESAIQTQTGHNGIGLARGWAFVQGGPNAVFVGTFSRSSGYTLNEGDMVVVELATCVDGYWSDLTRTGVVGAPNEKQAALLAAVRAAQEAAIREVREGAACGQVDNAARTVLNERGYGAGFTHPTGHQVGFRYHDAGPTLEAGSRARLEAGMVVTVEPGVYGAAFGGGARLEDNILVTEDGPISLSPHELVGTSMTRG